MGKKKEKPTGSVVNPKTGVRASARINEKKGPRRSKRVAEKKKAASTTKKTTRKRVRRPRAPAATESEAPLLFLNDALDNVTTSVYDSATTLFLTQSTANFPTPPTPDTPDTVITNGGADGGEYEVADSEFHENMDVGDVVRRLEFPGGENHPSGVLPSWHAISEAFEQSTTEYQRRMDEVEEMRNFKRTTEHALIKEAFRTLPMGYGLYPKNDSAVELVVNGYTLRELLLIICDIGQFADGTPFDLSQLYLYGECYDFHVGTTIVMAPADPSSNLNGQPWVIGSGVRANRWSVRMRRVINTPLSQIVIPEGDDTFWTSVEDENATGDFESLLDSYLRHIVGGDDTGSDVALSTFVLARNVRFLRLNPFPVGDTRRSLTIRTGSFEKILLEDLIYKLENGGLLFVPGGVNRILFGMDNCVLHCLLWGLYQEAVQMQKGCDGGRSDLITAEDHEFILKECIEEVKTLQKEFYDGWYMERLLHWMNRYSEKNDGASPPPSCVAKFSRQMRSNYVKMVQHGFSRKMMKRFVDFLADRDICFLVHKKDSTNKKSFIATHPDIHHPYPRKDVFRFVSCYQIDLEGNFLEVISDKTPSPHSGPMGDVDGGVDGHEVLDSSGSTEQSSSSPLDRLASFLHRAEGSESHIQQMAPYYVDEYPKMYHCVALFPPVRDPPLEYFRGVSGGLEFQQGLQRALRKSNYGYIFEKDRMKVKHLIENYLKNGDLIRKTLKCQEERCKTILDRKLFVENGGNQMDDNELGAYDEDGNFLDMNASAISSSGQTYRENYRASKKKDFYGVIVYDLETVENLRGCQDKVHPDFRKLPPPQISDERLKNLFTVPESQIPYSVQYGFVNFDKFIDSRDGRQILIDEDVHLCFGMLGECVNRFMFEATVNAFRFQMSRVYCYAHNGAAFDTYLVMKFLTFAPAKITNILITARGVLNLSIDVDITHPIFKEVIKDDEMQAFIPGRKAIRFFFRDTRVFFGAKLSDLCKIFKVPSGFCKTDFPITGVHARNFDDPIVRAAYQEYLCNDVYSLAYIVRGINAVVEDDILPEYFSDRFKQDAQFSATMFRVHLFGIGKYLTLMSLATKLQDDLFKKAFRREECFHKSSIVIDLPFLRHFITYANNGGRVLPFWRSFFSFYSKDILRSWTQQDEENGKAYRMQMYRKICHENSYGIVLDVTSLYPYAMSAYPMPTGNIRYVGKDIFERVCFELGCPTCHSRRSLCSIHADVHSSPLLQLGFIVFVVQFVVPPKHSSDNCVSDSLYTRQFHFQNLCPRKKVVQGKAAGLQYDFRGQQNCDDMPFVQSFTHYDLYWMLKCGWKFDILFGIQFGVSYVYHNPLHDMFEKRKKAKQTELEKGLPKSLSTMWKNLYNGMYGINARKDINSQHIVADKEATEAELRKNRRVLPDDIISRDGHSHELTNGQWLLKLKKLDVTKETFAQQSPVQIGAAVTAAARHHMNLLLYPMSNEDYGYTDTDSVFITGDAYETLRNECPHLLDDRADADMGTYKNDHEGGDHERVIASFLLAKKVKLHITLDALGTIRFHDTFKGFRPNAIDYSTSLVRPEQELMREKLEVLGNLFFVGKHNSQLSQTEFRRNSLNGITIDKDSVFTTEERTYYGHSEASIAILNRKYCVELLLPHGYRNPDTPHEPVVRKFYEELDGKLHRNPAGTDRCVFYDSDGLNSSGRKKFFADTEFFMEIWPAILDKIWRKKEVVADVSGNNYSENDEKWVHLFQKAPQLTDKDFSW